MVIKVWPISFARHLVSVRVVSHTLENHSIGHIGIAKRDAEPRSLWSFHTGNVFGITTIDDALDKTRERTERWNQMESLKRRFKPGTVAQRLNILSLGAHGQGIDGFLEFTWSGGATQAV